MTVIKNCKNIYEQYNNGSFYILDHVTVISNVTGGEQVISEMSSQEFMDSCTEVRRGASHIKKDIAKKFHPDICNVTVPSEYAEKYTQRDFCGNVTQELGVVLGKQGVMSKQHVSQADNNLCLENLAKFIALHKYATTDSAKIDEISDNIQNSEYDHVLEQMKLMDSESQYVDSIGAKDSCVKQYKKLKASSYEGISFDSFEIELMVMKAQGDLPKYCHEEFFK